MLVEDCFFVGTVVSKYSFKGEVLLKLDTDEPDRYQSLTTIFLAHNNALVPYFVVKCSMHKPGLLRLKLEDVSSEEVANSILKAKAYLPLSELPPLSGNKFYYHEVIGFSITQNGTQIGTILRIIEQGLQALFEITDNQGAERLIPIHDDFILEVDRASRNITVQLPEGLLEL